MTAATPASDTPGPDEFECMQERTLEGARRCIRLLLTSLDRDHEHCGKSECPALAPL